MLLSKLYDADTLDVKTISLSAAVCFLAYWILLVVYRVFFHPLARYPGPFVNKFSPVPAIIYLLRGRMGMEVKLLHDKYGMMPRHYPSYIC